MKKIAVLLAVAMMASTAGHAATLEATGQVSVNRGSGFLPVSGAAQVSPGDRVMVGPGASAQIVYDGGCREVIAAGSVGYVKGASLKDGPVCAASTSAAHAATGSGIGGFTAGQVVGAVAVVGVGAASIALLHKNSSASP